MADAISGSAVKADLPAYLVRRLESDAPGAFDKAARKAKLWVVSRYRKCNLAASDVDWNDPLVTEAATLRGHYEIYALDENEDVAADKKESAADLLEGVLGDCADTDTDDEAPGSSVRPAERPSFLEGFESRTRPHPRVP